MMRSILCTLLFILSACGGGGGGGGGNEPLVGAEADLKVSAREIFVGDRVRIRVRVRDVHPDGLLLQIRFPASALRYVPDTSFLKIDGEAVNISPATNRVVDQDLYLIYVFPYETFRDDDGDIEFELRGVGGKAIARIEVDPNIRNPNRPDSEQFNAENVRFATDLFDEIRVVQ